MISQTPSSASLSAIEVTGRRKGTFIARARVYSEGIVDENSGNNRVGMTVHVKGKRDG